MLFPQVCDIWIGQGPDGDVMRFFTGTGICFALFAAGLLHASDANALELPGRCLYPVESRGDRQGDLDSPADYSGGRDFGIHRTKEFVPDRQQKPVAAPDISWVRISGGTFMMGSEKGRDKEKPVHKVTLSSFEIAKTEVTVAQYMACVKAGVCSPPHFEDGRCRQGKKRKWRNPELPDFFRGDDLPVVCVDWRQAKAWCRWVGGRLPTEAEWEYVARGCGKDIRYPWGDREPGSNLAVISDVDGQQAGKCPEAVCSVSFGNTSDGLCDMAGNVREWVSDWLDTYPDKPVDSPVGPVNGTFKVMRGGSWRHGPKQAAATVRMGGSLGYNDFSLGFRPVRNVR